VNLFMWTHRRLDSIDLVPWKNGGGTTRQLLRIPDGSTLDDFAIRISVANVNSSGPFSSFANVTRALVILDGRMDLRVDGEPETVTLEALDRVFEFDGATAIDAAVEDDVVRDFNVMVRQPRKADVTVLRQSVCVETSADCELLLVLCARGEWDVDGLAEPLLGDEFAFATVCAAQRVELKARNEHSVAILVQIL
jgi:environmental stress-induced protein Ves